MSPRALQQAPFRVLVGANMPAVLVELGFLTNAQQEQQLAGDEHQNALVQALVEGIVRYRARRRHALSGSAAISPSAPSSSLVVAAGVDPVHRPAALVRRASDARRRRRPDRRARRPRPAVRKITATLYYVGDDGMALVPVQREVPFGATVVEQARAIIEAQIAAAPPHVSAIPADTKLRDVFVTERGDAFVDLSGEHHRQAPGRLARRNLHGLYPRQCAHGEPAGRDARADPGRRQGSRHSRRSRRPAASAREELEWVVHDIALTDVPPRSSAPPRSLPDSWRMPKARCSSKSAARRVICTASVEDRVPPFLRNTGQGLGHRGIRDAAARDVDADAARSQHRQGRRAHAGDPAADRALAALGGEAQRARRADDLGRLRRHPGRRRHAHRVHHRRLRGAWRSR